MHMHHKWVSAFTISLQHNIINITSIDLPLVIGTYRNFGFLSWQDLLVYWVVLVREGWLQKTQGIHVTSNQVEQALVLHEGIAPPGCPPYAQDIISRNGPHWQHWANAAQMLFFLNIHQMLRWTMLRLASGDCTLCISFAALGDASVKRWHYGGPKLTTLLV